MDNPEKLATWGPKDEEKNKIISICQFNTKMVFYIKHHRFHYVVKKSQN